MRHIIDAYRSGKATTQTQRIIRTTELFIENDAGQIVMLLAPSPRGGGIIGIYGNGSACAEIVHDIAPDAEIHLYKVGNFVDLENAKDAAIQEGLDIVTVSLGWDFARGFGDGTGSACEIVDDAFQNNVLWVNAAGNEARRKISARTVPKARHLMGESNPTWSRLPG